MSLTQRQKILALQQKVAELQAEIDADNIEKDSLQAKVDQLQTAISALEQENADDDAKIADLSAQLSQTQSALSAARNDLQAANTALAAANAEIERLKHPTDPTPDPTPDPDPTPSDTRPFVGAAVQGNGDVTPMESSAGRVLGLHRTYYNYDSIDSSISMAKADVAKGRVPWLSYKLPVSWSAAAAGQADAQTRTLATKLATVPGLVWVAIHHEPEGDGTMSDWVKVQQRLLPILQAVPNVRTSIILTAYDTFKSGNASYSLTSLWPGSMVDILGFDCYNRYGDADHPSSGWTEMKDWYALMAPEAKKRGVDWAIGETGYTDAAAQKDAGWLTRAYDDMANQPTLPGSGLSYFNSSLNSNGSWPLNAVKTPKFNDILNRSHGPLK